MSEKKKTMAVMLAAIILVFYTVIIEYISFAVMNIAAYKNFVASMVFQSIGIVLLFIVILGSVAKGKNVKIGFLVPIVICTVIYVAIVNCINFIGVAVMSGTIFVLLHLILLFVYSVIVMPMYIIGKQ